MADVVGCSAAPSMVAANFHVTWGRLWRRAQIHVSSMASARPGPPLTRTPAAQNDSPRATGWDRSGALMDLGRASGTSREHCGGAVAVIGSSSANHIREVPGCYPPLWVEQDLSLEGSSMEFFQSRVLFCVFRLS